MKQPLVNYSSNAGIATLELNHPPANCYSYEMMQQLDAAILSARFDDDVHVLILRSAGEKFFCAGADITMLGDVTPSFKYMFCLHANETLNRLEQSPKLTIAALHGHAVGGGLEVALACDLRVAARDTGKIGLPEVKLGVLPGTGGTQRLVRIVGKSRAIELMASGELFDFERARQLGLVDQIWESDAFEVRLAEYAANFCPPRSAAKAIGLIKRSVQTGAELPFQDALGLERELQQRLFESDDAREGIAAYVDKREPRFTGR